jgi:hypothetical protein
VSPDSVSPEFACTSHSSCWCYCSLPQIRGHHQSCLLPITGGLIALMLMMWQLDVWLSAGLAVGLPPLILLVHFFGALLSSSLPQQVAAEGGWGRLGGCSGVICRSSPRSCFESAESAHRGMKTDLEGRNNDPIHYEMRPSFGGSPQAETHRGSRSRGSSQAGGRVENLKAS